MSAFDFASPPPEGLLDEHKKYSHPLIDRYASKEMSYVFSPVVGSPDFV